MHCNAERRPPAGSPDIPLVLATSRQVGQHHGAMVICAATIISNACIPSHPSFQSHRSGYCGNMKDDCMFAPSYIADDPSQSPKPMFAQEGNPQSPDYGRRGSTIVVIGEILFVHAICASYHFSYSMCWLRFSRVWVGTYSAVLLLMSSAAQSENFWHGESKCYMKKH